MGKTILITGSSSGIGRETVRLFLRKGWNVIASMRSPEKEVEFKTGEKLLVVRLDVTNSDTIEKTIEKGIEKFSKIDALVNNAGYGLLGPFETASDEQIAKQFETNVFGSFRVIRAILPHFKQQKSGTIINLSSMLGRISLPFFSIYAASKYAIEGFSESLRFELEPFNIKIKLIEPGTIKTDFYSRSLDLSKNTLDDYKKHFQKVITNISHRGENGEPPATVAKTVYKAASDNSDKFRYISDSNSRFLINLRRLTPLRLYTQLIKNSVG